VVMAIIAVLMGLLMSGVMAALQARDRSANQFDMGKLDQGMSVATKQYAGSKTLPGYVVLCNNMDVYRNPSNYTAIIPKGVTALDLARSQATLRKMFGERFVTNGQVVDWDNSFATTAKKIPGIGDPNSVILLEGHQCLVFYVGGIADTSVSPPNMTGFSGDPLNPTVPGGTDRIGPFYTFERPRLVTSGYGTSARFPAYADRYGTPYAYYGGTGGSNSYVGGCPTLLKASQTPSNPIANLSVPGYPDSTAARFMKPDSYQIASAGRDRQFADPGLYNPTTGIPAGAARDDVSNFSVYAMANPQR